MKNDQNDSCYQDFYEAGLESAKRADVAAQDRQDIALKFVWNMLCKDQRQVRVILQQPYAAAWRRRCANNFVRDCQEAMVRLQRREVPFPQKAGEPEDSLTGEWTDGAPSPEVLALRACFLADLRAVSGLTEEQQDLLNRRYLLGQDRKTMAAPLGISLTALDQRLARLEKRLPDLLEGMGWSFEIVWQLFSTPPDSKPPYK